MSQKQYAGFFRRLMAAIIDTSILWIPCSIFGWLISYDENATFLLIDFLQMTLIWVLYYGVLESSEKQGTFGKQFLNLKVTDINGHRLSFGKAVSRYLAGFISVITLGIGFLMIAWTKKKQGLHDIICNCVVIRNGAS